MVSTAEKSLTFSSDINEIILDRLKKKQNFALDSKNELATGIQPNPDVVSKKALEKIPKQKILKYSIKAGDGVFVVKHNHLQNLNSKEEQLLKPLWEPYELEKYLVPDKHEKQIIYFTKQEKPEEYPQIIEHLNKYREIMDERRENQQGRLNYYNLHWPRVKSFFEEGAKILCVRKCETPTFSFTENEAYVMLSVNVIKTDRIDLKYLTALLNSKLIAFWLRSKGKMQGSNYQVDQEPLLEIPIFKANYAQTNGIILLVDKILAAKKMTEDSSDLEKQIDTLIYQLYELTPDEINIVENSSVLRTQETKNQLQAIENE